MAEVHDPFIHMVDCPWWLTRFTSYPDPCDCGAGVTEFAVDFTVQILKEMLAKTPPCPVSEPGGDGKDCTCENIALHCGVPVEFNPMSGEAECSVCGSHGWTRL